MFSPISLLPSAKGRGDREENGASVKQPVFSGAPRYHTMIGRHSFYLFPEPEGRDGIFIPHLSALGRHPGVLRGSTSFILIKAVRGSGKDAIFKV